MKDPLHTLVETWPLDREQRETIAQSIDRMSEELRQEVQVRLMEAEAAVEKFISRQEMPDRIPVIVRLRRAEQLMKEHGVIDVRFALGSINPIRKQALDDVRRSVAEVIEAVFAQPSF